MCLLLLIEARSHLLRLYGLGRDVRAALATGKQSKDTNKAPAKVHGITGERFWTRSNGFVESLMKADEGAVLICKDFLAAMSAEEDVEATDANLLGTDVIGEDAETLRGQRTGTPSARKRKLSATPGTTPTKRARGRPRKSHTRRSSSISTNEDAEGDYEGW